MSLPEELALFPLDIVLFPGMVQPLHIFEPRYRRMVNLCLDRHEPFGMVLTRSGPTPYSVGTAAHITRVERLSDGRMNILVIGRERFRVNKFSYHQPFLVSHVQSFPIRGATHPDCAALARDVRARLDQYVAYLENVMGQKLNLQHIPREPEALAFVAAIALQVDLTQKQRLLEVASVPELLALERKLLHAETAILEYMERTRGLADAAGSASPN